MQCENNAFFLSPYRVLDLTDEKGWLCGKILADLGCDVIKVEKPDGGLSRKTGPFYKGALDPDKSIPWLAFNANKRGITLNIESKVGKGTKCIIHLPVAKPVVSIKK